MLKLKLATLDGLAPELAKEYKQEGDVFVLDTDVPFEDVKPIKNALQAEKAQRKTATERVTVLEAEVVDLTARAGSPKDIEKSWSEKLTKAETAAKQREATLNGSIQKLLVENVATQLATELSTSPNLLKPHIMSRLTVVEEDGQHVTRVLGPDGKLSADSVKDLRAEILANADYAPILVGSKASGGGAQGGGKGGGGANSKAYKDMSEAERSTLYNTDRAKFDQLRAEFKQSEGSK